jgi:hypothetical protein
MRRVLIAIAVCALIATRAQDAFAQCSITMLDVGGATMLCAGNGDAWQWTGPGGFSGTDMCVTVTLQGTYTLRVFDAASGTWGDPCSQLVGDPPTGPSCSIDGVDSVCAGSSAHWCAPVGNYQYAWSGPSGFGATSQCVDVSAAGTYSLRLTDMSNGATGDACTLTLRVVDCSAPHTTDVCPRTARWWTWGCSDHNAPLSSDAFARVAAGVDQRSALWDYNGSASGLCDLLERRHHGGEMSATRRQFAAVLANLTAAALGIVDDNGQTIGIDPNHGLDGMRGYAPGMTVGQWAAATEQALLSLSASNGHERRSKEGLERIRKEARKINAGARSGACFGQSGSMADDDDDDLSGEPDTPSAGFTAGGSTGSSGPFSGPTRMRWTLDRASQVELAIVDVSGRRVRHLVSGMFAAGAQEFTWDGRDDDGRAVRAGAYFVAGTIGGQRTSQRLFLLH